MLDTDAREARKRQARQEGLLHRLFGVGPVAENQAGGPERGDIALFQPRLEVLFHHPPL